MRWPDRSKLKSTVSMWLLLITVCSAPAVALAGPVIVATGPDGWRAEAQREEIAPVFKYESQEGEPHKLVISGNGSDADAGWWAKEYEVTPGAWYRMEARYEAHNVALPRRSVLVQLQYFSAEGRGVAPTEYPLESPEGSADGRRTISGIYQMPENCTRVRLQLVLRWSADGEVRWSDAGLTEVEPPGPRPVRVAAIRYRPPERTSGPEENLELFTAMVRKAAEHQPDIICLGEGITVVRTSKSYVEVAEPIPGPSTRRLGALSKQYDCYIVAGLYERDGPTVYNTSVLMGPDGEMVGKYRKTCLPREEIDGGIAPGHEYPVFATRFGTVGMMICWDIHFPEVARRLANAGAEVILAPTWGGVEALARARAIENQVYVVTSTYNPRIRTAVFDRNGEPLAVATDEEPIALAEIDLNERNIDPWIGEWRARFVRERPPADAEWSAVE